MFTNEKSCDVIEIGNESNRFKHRKAGLKKEYPTLKLCGKFSTLIDSLPIHFRVTGGEVHDSFIEAPKLVADLPKADCIIADRSYDSEEL